MAKASKNASAKRNSPKKASYVELRGNQVDITFENRFIIDNCIIVPNTLGEFLNIVSKVTDASSNPFIIAVANKINDDIGISFFFIIMK